MICETSLFRHSSDGTILAVRRPQHSILNTTKSGRFFVAFGVRSPVYWINARPDPVKRVKHLKAPVWKAPNEKLARRQRLAFGLLRTDNLPAPGDTEVLDFARLRIRHDPDLHRTVAPMLEIESLAHRHLGYVFTGYPTPRYEVDRGKSAA